MVGLECLWFIPRVPHSPSRSCLEAESPTVSFLCENNKEIRKCPAFSQREPVLSRPAHTRTHTCTPQGHAHLPRDICGLSFLGQNSSSPHQNAGTVIPPHPTPSTHPVPAPLLPHELCPQTHKRTGSTCAVVPTHPRLRRSSAPCKPSDVFLLTHLETRVQTHYRHRGTHSPLLTCLCLRNTCVLSQ